MRGPTFNTADDFLKEKEYFNLGILPTEQQNQKTSNLSHLAKHDVREAIRAVRSVDGDALDVLINTATYFPALSKDIHNVLKNGGKIFLCGCGATGRLSLVLETLWRETQQKDTDAVVGFMAGGDIALVRAVENFEDLPLFGARHLMDLGFKKGDLLISSTEGGETPFVIGATERAAEIAEKEGGMKPYFLYCNPDDVLMRYVERSRRVIRSDWIHSISIPTGPMALSGSTRLQASTVLMYGIGLAFFHKHISEEQFVKHIYRFKAFFLSAALEQLESFIVFESEAVSGGNFLLYETGAYGVTVLTDTTERSPTFSLQSFESVHDAADVQPSISYLGIPRANTSEEAWRIILGRPPRGLMWEEFQNRLSAHSALGFDFSTYGMALRKERIQPKAQEHIHISDTKNGIRIRFNEREITFPTSLDGYALSVLEKHLFLKLILNTHSLIVMGRLGRYEKNVMTWVRASNGKLIDRAIRYVNYLLQSRNVKVSYEDIARKLFEVRKTLKDDEPIVLKVADSFA